MLPLLLLGGISAAAPAPPTSVLVMPIQYRGDVNKDLAEQITAWITAQAGKLPGYRIVAFREVEGAMSQEQARQIAGCDQLSCAAEIAGALNTDEIVIGSLGTVGDNYILTLTRIRSRDAAVPARVAERFSGRSTDVLLDRIPLIVTELFGVQDAVATTEAAAPEGAPAAAPVEADAGSGGVPSGILWAARAAGGAVVGAGALTLLACGLLAAVGLGIYGYDAARVDHAVHRVPQVAAIGSNAALAVGLAVVPLALLLGLVGGTVSLITLVIP